MSDKPKKSNRVSIYVSDEIRAKMEQYPYINWSALFSNAVEDVIIKAERVAKAMERSPRE